MNPRQKAKDLIRLASDESTSASERAVAAVQACGLIQKHKLLDSPLDAVGDALRGENETVKAAQKIYDAVRNPDPELVDALKSIAKRFVEKPSSTRRSRRSRR